MRSILEEDVGLGRFDFSKMILFTNGVAVGDLGAKIAQKLSQQGFLGVIF